MGVMVRGPRSVSDRSGGAGDGNHETARHSSSGAGRSVDRGRDGDARTDGESDVSDPQQLVERLEAAGIGGCRAEDERTAGCFDAAGVAYFRGELIDEEISIDEAVALACDESTIVALFTEGQGWLGRVRAHSERAPDLAAALSSTAIDCEGARASND